MSGRERQFAAANDRLHRLIYPENWKHWACYGVLAGVTIATGSIIWGFTASCAVALVLR